MTMLHNYKAEGNVLRLFELVIYCQFQRILYNSNVLINPRNNQDVATIRRYYAKTNILTVYVHIMIVNSSYYEVQRVKQSVLFSQLHLKQHTLIFCIKSFYHTFFTFSYQVCSIEEFSWIGHSHFKLGCVDNAVSTLHRYFLHYMVI